MYRRRSREDGSFAYIPDLCTPVICASRLGWRYTAVSKLWIVITGVGDAKESCYCSVTRRVKCWPTQPPASFDFERGLLP